jgi:hypothetical protein
MRAHHRRDEKSVANPYRPIEFVKHSSSSASLIAGKWGLRCCARATYHNNKST